MILIILQFGCKDARVSVIAANDVCNGAKVWNSAEMWFRIIAKSFCSLVNVFSVVRGRFSALYCLLHHYKVNLYYCDCVSQWCEAKLHKNSGSTSWCRMRFRCFICALKWLSIHCQRASRLCHRLRGRTDSLTHAARAVAGRTSRFESLSVPDDGSVGGS